MRMIDDALLAQVQEEILKAAETVATSTFSPATRSVFSPENLDEKIKLLVPTDTPLRNRLPRVPGKGQATAWKVMTSKLHTGADGSNTTIFFADAAAPSETSQTYSVVSAAYKLLGRKLEVGGLALAASANRDGQPDMMAEREKVKMYELMLGEEEAIISGDAASRPNEFSGLHKQITTHSGTAVLLSASGVGVYCNTLYEAGASPTMLLANGFQIKALTDDLEKSGSIQRVAIVNQGGVTGGAHVEKLVNPVDGTLIDVMPSRFVGATALLLTEKSPAGEAWIEMEDLIPVSRIDVPSSNYSYISFIIEACVCKVLGEPYQYKLAGLATS